METFITVNLTYITLLKGLMREVMETYKPHILSRRRRLIEDCVRDLRLNNDHIHIIEQEMRKAIQVGFFKIWFSYFDRN